MSETPGSPRISIRKATIGDAALLAELGARTFHDTFAAENTVADMAAYLAASFAADIQAEQIADPASVFLLAHVGDELAGYARLRSGAAPEQIAGEQPVEIVRFYADAPWIGAGVGAALMRESLAEALARKRDVIWLDVWERNPRAIAFYSKWGFTVVGEQSFALGADLQRDLLMARSVARIGRDAVLGG